jgi:hypothetical protein
MVQANVKIISELKFFLQTVCNDAEIRKLFTYCDNAFSRNRKLPLGKLISMLINLPKRSLSIEIQEFFESIGTPDLSCTKGAFSLQRTKLNPIFFKLWNKCLIDSFYNYYDDNVKKWNGFTLLAVDGSTSYLFNKGDILSHFGIQSNQYKDVPMAQVMQIQDVLNDLILWSDIFPVKEPEQHIIADNIHHIPAGSLTLFDRGYPSYTLMFLLLNQEQPRHFVMRCRRNFNNAVKDFVNSSKESMIIELAPDQRTIDQLRAHKYLITGKTVIKVRLVKIKLSTGEQEILLTDLYDEKAYSQCELQKLYAMRWGIETAFSTQKNQQQMEIFTGHKVICIKQDYAAGIFTANLQSLIRKQADMYVQQVSERRNHDYKINKNASWAALKHRVVKLFLEEDTIPILLYLQKAFERNLEPIRLGRSYQRVRKARRTKGKYQTLTNYRRSI